MNRSILIASLGTSFFVAASLAACGSDSSSAPAPDAGKADAAADTGPSPDGGADTGADTGRDTGTDADADAAKPTLDCASYCGEVLASCTGANQQYGATATDDGMASCMGFCATFAKKGTLADTSGDTLGCHIYHGGAAKTAPATHCSHAGPTGGDKSVDGGAGACGEPCEAFCDGALALCPAVYATKAACMTACAQLKPDPATYLSTDTTLQSANTIGCRVYHLTAAAASPAAATTHCPHIAAVSAVCKN